MDYSLFVGIHHRVANHGADPAECSFMSSGRGNLDFGGMMARKRRDSKTMLPTRKLSMMSMAGSDTSSRDAASRRATLTHTQEDVFCLQHLSHRSNMSEHALSPDAHGTDRRTHAAQSEAEVECAGTVTADIVSNFEREEGPLWRQREEGLRRLREQVNAQLTSSQSMSFDETKVR